MPRLMSADPATRSARFSAKVQAGLMDGCWLWTGAALRSGYGSFRWSPGKVVSAHRAAWMLMEGDPGALHVLHTCDTPLCVNFSHLFLGTAKDNAADKVAKGRHPNSRMTHCRRAGHPFDEANTYVAPSGKRTCRACHREDQRRYQEAQRG